MLKPRILLKLTGAVSELQTYRLRIELETMVML